jgi:hypothetical protein
MLKAWPFQDLNELKKNGAPEEIRTPDPQIRSLVLYPAELRVRVAAAVNRLRGDPLNRPIGDCKRIWAKKFYFVRHPHTSH